MKDKYYFLRDENIHKYRSRYSVYNLIVTTNLKIFRSYRNYSTKKMCMLLGLPGRKIYLRFENGKKNITSKWLYLFSKVLEIPPSAFFVNRLETIGYKKEDLNF